jgi:hypothetical protein
VAAAVLKHRVRLGVAALSACCICNGVLAAPWMVRVDERAGLPSLSRGGAVALSSRFAYWAKDWRWAGQQTEFKVVGPFEYSITGRNPALNFDLAARVRKTSDRQMVWEFDLDARGTQAGVIGGGLSFMFDVADFGSALGEPELLAGNRGWSWGHAADAHIEMRFDPPVAAVYLERGKKSEVRAFFYSDSVPQGRKHYLATLTVSGDVALSPTSLERFGAADYNTWPQGILDWNTSPVDLSFLNAAEIPAGKHGFLKARGDRLVFDDGTVARFWGTNLTAYALFATSRENVQRQAQRLSQLGFNLVRLHHHDSEWVNPNIFGGRDAADTQTLSGAMLEKLDWWIKCLKDAGIYVWLDLEDGRRFKATDRIDAFEEISQGKSSAGLTGYSYVNSSIETAMRRFNEMYLNHQNRFTGLRYKDDPAVVAVLITNENDLTNHFGNALLPDKGVPRHAALYMRLAQEFADDHSLPRDKVWRAWEDGASKLFLNDLERRFDTDMIAQLRTMGVKAPVVTTSTWGENSLSSLPALTVGDIIDVHSFGGVGELEHNPMLAPNLVNWIAAAQVAVKPLSVTEWGLDAEGSFAPDRQNIPLYVAAAAAMQGWDALMLFAYSQEAFSEKYGTPSIYHAYNDPALIASLPAAALLYRQGHVAEAPTTYLFAPSEQELFYRAVSPANSVALRTASERGRLVVAMPKVAELPWLTESSIPPGVRLIRDARESQIPGNGTQVVSDSGELRRDWGEGIFTIDTARTQAAMGWIGGKTITLTDIEADVSTRNAVVAVQSLDGSPLRQSRRIMISVGARSVPKADRLLPFYSEPVEGRILITATPGLGLSAWDAQTGHMRRLALSHGNGRYVVPLERSLRSYWLLLEGKAPGKSADSVKRSN